MTKDIIALAVDRVSAKRIVKEIIAGESLATLRAINANPKHPKQFDAAKTLFQASGVAIGRIEGEDDTREIHELDGIELQRRIDRAHARLEYLAKVKAEQARPIIDVEPAKDDVFD